jgi:hypothetical protein
MRRKNTPLILAALLSVICLAFMAFALARRPEPVRGEFTPPPFDPAAESGTLVVPEGLGYSELDCQAYKVSLCGKLGEDGTVFLTNPKENTVWLKLRVLDEKGNILGETGLVRPGEYVKSVIWSSAPKSGTTVTLKIMAYEPDTYYSAGAASLNTIVA